MQVVGRPKQHIYESVGMYYTPKGLLPEPMDISTGTGDFLKQLADELEKRGTINPPYEVKQ